MNSSVSLTRSLASSALLQYRWEAHWDAGRKLCRVDMWFRWQGGGEPQEFQETHYQRAYEDCLTATSTKSAPWYAVPADDKENARLIISQVILDTLDSLKMSYPRMDKARRKELRSLSRQLVR